MKRWITNSTEPRSSLMFFVVQRHFGLSGFCLKNKGLKNKQLHINTLINTRYNTYQIITLATSETVIKLTPSHNNKMATLKGSFPTMHSVTEIFSETTFYSLRKDLNNLVAWSKEWQMLFNLDKCKIMHCRARKVK